MRYTEGGVNQRAGAQKRIAYDDQRWLATRPFIRRGRMMKRAKSKVSGKVGGVGAVGNDLVMGGAAVGKTRRGTGDAGAGRLGRGLKKAAKGPAGKPAADGESMTGRSKPTKTKARARVAAQATPTAAAIKALQRWENEGGRTQKPAAAGVTVSVKQSVRMSVMRVERSGLRFPAVSNQAGTQGVDGRLKNANRKGEQIKQAGMKGRLLGHLLGSGKRKQARRDSKN
jgi:hypothetical protein